MIVYSGILVTFSIIYLISLYHSYIGLFQGPNDLTLGVFDQNLDRSDYGSILSKNPLQPGYGKLLANHCFPASPTVPTACRTSDEARGLIFAIDTSQAPGLPQTSVCPEHLHTAYVPCHGELHSRPDQEVFRLGGGGSGKSV